MSISCAYSSTPVTIINWTDLQPDIVDIIIHRFDDIIDFINFGATCRTWRSVTLAHIRLRCRRRRRNSSQIPWLLLRPRIKPVVPPTNNSRRMVQKLTSTVPPLHFYNFSSKKSYFFSHPPHLMADINTKRVKLIGSNNGHLIYNDSVSVAEASEDVFSKWSSPNSILHFYNPINGTHFNLPPAPVFVKDRVIMNKNPYSDNVTVAVICFDDNVDYQISQKNCIAIIRTGDSEWTRFSVNRLVADDLIEDIIFHQERLYAITYYLKMIVFEDINDPTFLCREAKCMEGPAKKVLYKVEENESGGKTKVEYYDSIVERELLESPDGKELFLYATCSCHLSIDWIMFGTKLFRHDWNQGQWDLVKSSMDHDLSFFRSFDTFSVFWRSQSHLIANRSARIDIFTGFDESDGCEKRLSIPDNVEQSLYFWFIPNLS